MGIIGRSIDGEEPNIRMHRRTLEKRTTYMVVG